MLNFNFFQKINSLINPSMFFTKRLFFPDFWRDPSEQTQFKDGSGLFGLKLIWMISATIMLCTTWFVWLGISIGCVIVYWALQNLILKNFPDEFIELPYIYNFVLETSAVEELYENTIFELNITDDDHEARPNPIQY